MNNPAHTFVQKLLAALENDNQFALTIREGLEEGFIPNPKVAEQLMIMRFESPAQIRLHLLQLSKTLLVSAPLNEQK